MRGLILAAALLTALPAWAEVAGVPRVIDGDTLQIEKTKIRLFGIDAPEGKQTCDRQGVAWLCGQEAAGYLRKLLAGNPVTCSERNKDRYGRTVATCKLSDGQDLGAVMVGAGWALAYRQYGGKLYDAPELSAKGEKRGLWGGEFVPPWEYRRTH